MMASCKNTDTHNDRWGQDVDSNAKGHDLRLNMHDKHLSQKIVEHEVKSRRQSNMVIREFDLNLKAARIRPSEKLPKIEVAAEVEFTSMEIEINMESFEKHILEQTGFEGDATFAAMKGILAKYRYVLEWVWR